MQFKEGTDVTTFDGEKVGTVRRVVLDPRTKDVTHIVAQKGVLFTEDKLVPIDLIHSATPNAVTLRQGIQDLDTLRDFEEVHYVPLDDETLHNLYPTGTIDTAQPLYWYPPITALPGSPFAYSSSALEEGYATQVEQNIPDDMVALKEGANVISADGEHVGDIERIFVDPEAERATHFVITEGLIFKERKLIPATWVSTVGEDEVHLAVGSRMIDGLKEYKES
jgi:uncharacterized protein YrrD